MLVLTRKEAEGIQIGDVEVVVVEIHGNRVKLGIKAADSVCILRSELIDYHENDAA